MGWKSLSSTYLVVLAASLLTLACTTARTVNDDDASLRSFVTEFIASVNDADVDRFVGFFADDATAFLPSPENAARRSGTDEIRRAVAPVFAYGKPTNPVVARDIVITSSGNLAVISFDAGSGTLHSRRTLAVKRAGSGWKITHLHASNVREP